MGSDFDLKEQMFRNVEGALGPLSNVSVVLQFSKEFRDAEEERKVKDKATNIVLVLVTPGGSLADAVRVDVEVGDVVSFRYIISSIRSLTFFFIE